MKNKVKSKEFIPLAKGVWKDTYIYRDGTTRDTDWKPNQIQNGSAKIAAELVSKAVAGQVSSNNGFVYLALGEGNATWDVTAPDLDPSATNLLAEIDRIPITSSTDVIYLDPVTQLPVAGPTRMVEVSVFIDWNRGIGSLREFGLVVGDATSVSNSGELFNWVSHDLITKQVHPAPIQILRKIRIKWLVPSEVTVL